MSRPSSTLGMSVASTFRFTGFTCAAPAANGAVESDGGCSGTEALARADNKTQLQAMAAARRKSIAILEVQQSGNLCRMCNDNNFKTLPICNDVIAESH